MKQLATQARYDRSVLVERVHEALVRVSGQAPSAVVDSARLSADLGLDSFKLVELVNAIEDGLQQRIPVGVDRDLVGAETVGELLERLHRTFCAG